MICSGLHSAVAFCTDDVATDARYGESVSFRTREDGVRVRGSDSTPARAPDLAAVNNALLIFILPKTWLVVQRANLQDDENVPPLAFLPGRADRSTESPVRVWVGLRGPN
jgi:hypothetical protein